MEPDELEKLAAAFEENTAAMTAKIDDLQAQLDEGTTRAQRPSYGARGPASNEALTAELEAVGAFAKTGSLERLTASDDMNTADDVAGGYITMPKISDSIRAKLRDGVAMRRLARVVTLDSGDAYAEPIELDADSEATWVGEKATRPTTAGHDLGVDEWPLHELWASVKVTQRLLDLSFVNVGQFVEQKISAKFARSENSAFISGASQLQPVGLWTYPTDTEADFTRARGTFQNVLSGAATAITADSLRDLYWTVRAPYRTNASWLMASATANKIDKLKDGSGQYLWRDSSVAGQPPMLLGRPVEFDEGLPAVEAGSRPIAFGDFQQAYVIVDRLGLRMARDPFTAKPHVLFDAFKRTGGGAAEFHAIKFLQIAAAE